MTPSPLDPAGLRRSGRVVRNVPVRPTPAPPPDETTSAATATSMTVTKKRTRAVKGTDKAVDIGNATSQASAENESTPRKRCKKVAGKNAVNTDDGKDSSRMDGKDLTQMNGQDGADLWGKSKMDGKDECPDLSGRDIDNDDVDDSITKGVYHYAYPQEERPTFQELKHWHLNYRNLGTPYKDKI
ncbi:hypothetical protein BGZ96_007995 [Linnemannia gamsii]|uniref:Uncharacterized protein n=1 Tax=Linnemannia gamsii TaxID=64522 RepID=A0ABQ7JZ60_9FUNG|nr:hypothetical protein BGZ96_007995 [Linnemannia gamsii]